ncbi:hypothetical protein OOK13_45315 [Streptomyces sp. NBC_00378]|uniref:hypothetical protein n=1 Tax=unclassified Streptomyces TaxID=2593676 RepID=UPI00225996A4|nr:MULTISPECIES: hypothetical protein [unclassified Streptomyces]MCX5115509.1 hypothetical protein [Streptomyces sp. NBC_00378]MCX5115519.1 hypothetical protein [Streptomyces sp. NBC_00378]MCX5166375.1 hypothetical protein [Streptomyces sp. NBC_00305]MCX5166396.1 hypothetical protein [Streptomyces sp. NBC_00305]MCX5224893.1 hypothetical protein [Streptomyces sp. NBC_00264]
MSTSAPTPEYGAPYLPVTGTHPPRVDQSPPDALECGHDPSGGDCDGDCDGFTYFGSLGF